LRWEVYVEQTNIELRAEKPEDALSDEEVLEKIVMDVLVPIERERIELDPVDYEITVNRIKAILREGSFALARTSGSPIVTECAEYMLAIFDGDGHAAYVTAGVLPHLTATESAIKWIKYWFEDDPGIDPGDQFILNDPYIIGAHTNDIVIAKPLFHKDQIIAWVASLTHTVEVGAMEPGATAHSTDIFQEGIRTPGLKIIERGKASKPIFKFMERSVRDPQLMTLDTVAKIAANNVVAARIEDLIASKGPAFLKQVFRKMIYEGEDKSRQKVKAIPDGVWRSRTYGDFDGLEKNLFKIDLTCKKENDSILLDLSGTSPQNPGPINSSLVGSIGAIFSVFVSTLFSDLIWNRGILAPLQIHIPKGTIYNPTYPAPVNASPPTASALLAGTVTKVVSQMNMAAGFVSEVCAPWMSNWNGVFMGGINQYGKLQGTITMDANGGGTGATPLLDGGDTMAFILAPGALMADVESYEARNPLLYLFRKQRTNSCGHGKHRGGSGGEAAVMIHNTSNYRVGFRGVGKYVAATSGIFGGYPADSIKNGFIKNTNLKNIFTAEYKKIRTFDELKNYGEYQEMPPMASSTPVHDQDLYYLRWMGGGGYGDPLLRKPELVRTDVLDRIISAEIAERIYGVIIDRETMEIDHEETRIRREKAINFRRTHWNLPQKERKTGKPKHLMQQQVGREKVSIKIHESLKLEEQMGEYFIFCLHCGQKICKGNENYRMFVPRIDRNPSDLGHTLIDPQWAIYREYFCAGCATLLEVDPLRPGDLDLWDIEIAIPLLEGGTKVH